jgi:hypothetical protein
MSMHWVLAATINENLGAALVRASTSPRFSGPVIVSHRSLATKTPGKAQNQKAELPGVSLDADKECYQDVFEENPHRTARLPCTNTVRPDSVSQRLRF